MTLCVLSDQAKLQFAKKEREEPGAMVLVAKSLPSIHWDPTLARVLIPAPPLPIQLRACGW